jgi:hypothetical protein
LSLLLQPLNFELVSLDLLVQVLHEVHVFHDGLSHLDVPLVLSNHVSVPVHSVVDHLESDRDVSQVRVALEHSGEVESVLGLSLVALLEIVNVGLQVLFSLAVFGLVDVGVLDFLTTTDEILDLGA